MIVGSVVSVATDVSMNFMDGHLRSHLNFRRMEPREFRAMTLAVALLAHDRKERRQTSTSAGLPNPCFAERQVGCRRMSSLIEN